jgi:hypothetical protein
VVGGGAVVAWPLAARAQQAHGLSKSARIAFLGDPLLAPRAFFASAALCR